MYCVNCGNKLENNAKFCTNCGTGVNKEELKVEEVNNNIQSDSSSGTASLVLGIISLILFCIPIIGLVLGIISMVLGGNSKKGNNKSVGFVLGMAGTILNVVFSLFIILMFIFAFMDSDYEDDSYNHYDRYNTHDRHDGYM